VQLLDADIQTREVLTWKGVHVFHAHFSSCSQKLRIFLNCKNIAWESHPIDLGRLENLSPFYMGINRRGESIGAGYCVVCLCPTIDYQWLSARATACFAQRMVSAAWNVPADSPRSHSSCRVRGPDSDPANHSSRERSRSRIDLPFVTASRAVLARLVKRLAATRSGRRSRKGKAQGGADFLRRI
jgi:hypothetical protein